MIKRHIVFKKNEKKNIVTKLMDIYFNNFEKIDMPLSSMFDFYKNSKGDKIIIDYNNNNFSYNGKVNLKNILSFKNDYKFRIDKELTINEIKFKKF